MLIPLDGRELSNLKIFKMLNKGIYEWGHNKKYPFTFKKLYKSLKYKVYEPGKKKPIKKK